MRGWKAKEESMTKRKKRGWWEKNWRCARWEGRIKKWKMLWKRDNRELKGNNNDSSKDKKNTFGNDGLQLRWHSNLGSPRVSRWWFRGSSNIHRCVSVCLNLEDFIIPRSHVSSKISKSQQDISSVKCSLWLFKLKPPSFLRQRKCGSTINLISRMPKSVPEGCGFPQFHLLRVDEQTWQHAGGLTWVEMYVNIKKWSQSLLLFLALHLIHEHNSYFHFTWKWNEYHFQARLIIN